MAVLLFLGGLALLLTSAKYFVDGISRLAGALGVPPLVIGMTVVAFGTSTPELVVNGLSASRGETALAFGNIMGSCIVNVGFVLAVTALVRPLKVEPSLITREIPMLLLGVAAFLALASDRYLDGAAADLLARADGVILLLLFALFLYYTVIYSVAERLAGRAEDAFVAEVRAEMPRRRDPALVQDAAVTLAGLVGVSLGAGWTVDGATGLARLLGLPENVIGLTIVSAGTTLPELITCVMAARRGSADIALGNVVGSNIFNLLAIGGTVSVIHPLSIPAGGERDLWFMAVLTAILLPVSIRSGRTITRTEGAFLLALWVAYLSFRLAG